MNKTIKSQTSELEQLTQVIELIQHLFYISLQKFPNSPKLRILFAIFLMDIAQNKQQSMQELVNSELEKPSLDEQFTIQRLQMYLENQAQSISNNQNSHFSMNQTDFMMDISYQNQMKIFKDLIEASANNYTELWFQLLEDQPDLLKIKQIGFKINDLNIIIEEQFQKMTKVPSFNFTTPSLLFGKYLIELVDDNQRGKQVLQQVMGYQQKEQTNLNAADPSLEQSPTIIISADEDNFGIITNVNTSCCCFFGYQKVEMMNRNIKNFMPQVYSDRHDQFIRNFLQTLESRILNVEREVMIKQKNNYIKSANIMVKYIPSLSTGIQFIGQYNVNKVICHTAYMILDTEFYIENITSSCINMIHLDQNKLKKRKHIDEIIPCFQSEFKKYFYKGGCEQKISIQNSSDQVLLNIQIQDINLKNLGNSGYIVKLQNKNKALEVEYNTSEDQKVDQNIKSFLNQSILHNSEQTKSQKQEYFVLKYDPTQKRFIGQFYDLNAQKSGKSLLSPQISKQKDQASRFSFFSVLAQDAQENAQSDAFNMGKSQFSKQQSTPQVQDQKQYGEGIKTLRLCGKNIVDINILKEGEGDEQEEEDKEIQGMNEEENQKEDELNFEKGVKHSNIFKSRDIFVKFINNSDFLNPSLIQRSNLTILLFCAIFLLIFIINFVISGSSIQQSENQYTVLDNMNKFISESQYILNCMFDLQLLNSKVYDSKIVNFTQTTQNLQDSLNRLNYYHQNFDLSSLQLDAQSLNYLNNPTVPIFNPIGIKTDFFDFYQASSQFISKINQINSYSLDQFSINDLNIYYIQYNFLNSYYIISDQISKSISSQISSYSQQLGGTLFQMIIVAGVLLFIEIIAVIFIYFSLLLLIKQILILFLEIPLEKIQQLLFKSKKFGNQIQSGDEENISSNDSLSAFKKEDDKSFSITRISKTGKKLRKFRLESKQFKVFFIPFIITILILITYFTATFAIYQPTINQLQNFSNEFNSTSTLDQIFGISANVAQIMIMNITFQTVNQTSIKFQEQQMYELYQQIGDIQRYHIENMNLHNSAYNTYFQTTMMSDNSSNPCLLLSTTFQSSNCDSIANSTITKGMILLLTRQIESIRNLYLSTEYIYASITDTSEQQIQLNNLLNSDQAIEVKTLQFQYINQIFQQLSGQMITEINNSISSTNASNLFVVILCIIFLLISLIIIWMPLMSNIQRDISRTRNLVILIPLNVSKKCKFLRNLLSQYDEKLGKVTSQKIKK
ncbi:PAS domain S-box protein (macronuclear) [Tetrahymena thermophila SB210]|uniref:PAS domain S-box protein n=1 Tax=Tetrahymena thermophila (strain SB210) TaxID=312017 RepID=Q22HI2_TETTS|nr:PAS domain S-box protein [Tetrahymena thermophila SB210]EAR84719.2 PAS domain S-box protein [Tetrahymena thermophila SB210]|eukprot:XP_001032382.2 PAS domain S-box protein [Tetrahymena thermophila SB210]